MTVPLAGKDKWPVVKSFAAALAEEMVAATPQAYVATMSIADYAVRARSGAPVALPLDWKELKGLKTGSQFTMKDVLTRVKNKRRGPSGRPEGQSLPKA